MKRLSKDGSHTYNIASESGFGEYPRTCHQCGERIYITKEAVWFGHDETGAKASWHWDHRPLKAYSVSARDDNTKAAEHIAPDLLPSCPRCGDLSAAKATVCETCGARLTEPVTEKA